MHGYDPIAVLMEEHQVYLRRLRDVRASVRRWTEGARDRAGAPTEVATFAEFLATDVDGFHGQKEERALFPVLARHIGREEGTVGVMLEEHETLRHHPRAIASSAPKLEADPEAVEAWNAVVTATEAVDRLLAFHIEKEDHVLFPMARELLTGAEMVEVAQVCLEIEERLGSRGRTGPSPPRDPR